MARYTLVRKQDAEFPLAFAPPVIMGVSPWLFPFDSALIDALCEPGNCRIVVGQDPGYYTAVPLSDSLPIQDPLGSTMQIAGVRYVYTDIGPTGNGQNSNASITELELPWPEELNGQFDPAMVDEVKSGVEAVRATINKSNPVSHVRYLQSVCTGQWNTFFPGDGVVVVCENGDRTSGQVNEPSTTTYSGAVGDPDVMGNEYILLNDGQGGIRATVLDSSGQWQTAEIATGDDETARAALSGIAGVVLGPDAAGILELQMSPRLLSMRLESFPGKFDFMMGVSEPEIGESQSSGQFYAYYVIDGGAGPQPPVYAPPATFTYPDPTLNDPAQLEFPRWSLPPLKTRIPFQNYTHSVPAVRFPRRK